ncbi:MAG: GNAT family N-acetyltransferase [Anaerolineae bacterium]|nr:GNAT family N-acetyltransferase [Anaerolineae bacterium]
MNEALAIAPASPVTIQPAGWRDLNPVRELERMCFPLDAWPLLDMLGVLGLPSVLRWKAVADGKTIGFVAADVRRLTGLAWIATICVHSDYRGRGIGERLLMVCERNITVPRVRLSLRASNEAALRLYTRCGYSQVGTWVRYYKGGEDALVMEKKLDN